MYLTPGKWTEGMRLTPKARADFLSMAKKVLTNRQVSRESITDVYKGRAKSSGVNPANVIPEIPQGSVQATPTQIYVKDEKGDSYGPFKTQLDADNFKREAGIK